MYSSEVGSFPTENRERSCCEKDYLEGRYNPIPHPRDLGDDRCYRGDMDMKKLWEFLLCVTFIRRCRICRMVKAWDKMTDQEWLDYKMTDQERLGYDEED